MYYILISLPRRAKSLILMAPTYEIRMVAEAKTGSQLMLATLRTVDRLLLRCKPIFMAKGLSNLLPKR